MINRTLSNPFIITLLTSIAIAGASAAAQAADQPCECWYRGYEDGMEYKWDQRSTAENFKMCSDRGQVKHYEAGFQTAIKREPRTCKL